MLCPNCASIFTGTRLPTWTPSPPITRADGHRDFEAESAFERSRLRALHSDILHMAQYAVAGCTICDIIWRHFFRDKSAEEYLGIPHFYRNGMIHVWTGSGTHYRFVERVVKGNGSVGGEGGIELQVGLNSPMDKDISEYKDIGLERLSDEPAINPSHIPQPSPTIYGAYTFNTIKKWIQNCCINHAQCNIERKSPPWYPTRLIDVAYQPPLTRREQIEDFKSLLQTGWLPATVRIVETAKREMKGPYLTLSHRWAPSYNAAPKPPAYSKGLNLILSSAHPRTFIEAIHFTRALGVRYLWIDTLCIIQDDEVDKMREIKNMRKVYANSMLNLEATVGNGRLFQERNVKLIEPLVVKTEWVGDDGKRLARAKGGNEVFVVSDYRFWDSRITRSVCNTRGWITQERWLAPRVLHFTFDQLLWECRELEAAESFPRGLTMEAKAQSSIGFKAFTPKIRSDNTQPTTYESRLSDWHDVLLTYGRSELTKEKDRLLAVAGVAERFSEMLKDEWVAGLWRKCLPGELLWSIDKTRRSNAPPSKIEIAAEYGLGVKKTHKLQFSERLKGNRYQAPSWSWASVLGDIIPGYFTLDGSEDSMIDVVDISLTPFDPDFPLGQLADGQLRLRGRLYPLAIDPPDWTPDIHKRNYTALPPVIHIAGLEKKEDRHPLIDDMRTLNLKMGLPPMLSHTHVARTKADEPLDYNDAARSFFLPVRSHIYRKEGSEYDGTKIINGLVLMPTERKGEYVRLGVVDFHGEKCELFEKDRAENSVLGATRDGELYIEGEEGVMLVV